MFFQHSHEKNTYNTKVVVKDNEKLTVTGVAASSATTLTVTGTKLGELTTDSFKVSPEIAVTAYAAAADGKTATVSLASAMMSAAKYTVTVLEQSYEVTYTVGEITSVAVTETTYDDDTAGQVVAITVNGGSPITVNDLIADGYYVSFSATKDGAAKKIFAGTSASETSMTGELVSKFDGTTYTDAKVDSYQIQVVLTKGSTIITSPLATIKIANLNASATEIKSYELTGKLTGASTEDVVLTGNTLVVGETAELTKATITTKDGAVELPSAVLSLVSISSSDKGIISVNTATAGKVSIEAVAPGTATLTFSYGSVSKTATYTVTNTARKVASVVAKDSVVRLTSSNTTGVDTTIIVKDQYGEFYNGLAVESSANAPATGSNGVAYTSNANLATVDVASSTKTDKKGEFKATVKAVSATTVGSAYLMVSYWDAAQNKTAYTAASIVVTAANAADPSKNQLYAKAKTGRSDDLTLNLFKSDDNKVDLALKTFTKDNALVNASVDLKDHYFKYNKAIIDVDGATTTINPTDGSTIYTVASSATEATFTAKGKGSTTVSLYDKDNKLVATAVVTVTDTTPKLTAITFNSKCPSALTTAGEYVDLTQVFNIKASANDPIIEGLTVSEAYAGELRVDITGATAEIYIDADSDGDYKPANGDYIVGSIKLTAKESNGSAVTPAPNSFTYTLASGGSAKTLYYTVYDGATSDTSAKVIAAKTVSVSL